MSAECTITCVTNVLKTRDTAAAIERRLNAENHQVACLTGQFEAGERDVIIDSFRKGESKVLITTNVLSRGIDIQTVSLVVNYVGQPLWVSNLKDANEKPGSA